MTTPVPTWCSNIQGSIIGSESRIGAFLSFLQKNLVTILRFESLYHRYAKLRIQETVFPCSHASTCSPPPTFILSPKMKVRLVLRTLAPHTKVHEKTMGMLSGMWDHLWIRWSLKALQKFRLALIGNEYEICQPQLLWPLIYANGLWWELLSSTIFTASSERFRFLTGLIVWGTERHPDELHFHSNIILSFSHCYNFQMALQVRVTSNAHQILSHFEILLACITTWFILRTQLIFESNL